MSSISVNNALILFYVVKFLMRIDGFQTLAQKLLASEDNACGWMVCGKSFLRFEVGVITTIVEWE